MLVYPLIFQSYSLSGFPMERPLKLCLSGSLQKKSYL